MLLFCAGFLRPYFSLSSHPINMKFGHDIPRVVRYTAMTFPSHPSCFYGFIWIRLLLKGKRQFLLTCKVSRYYLLPLHGSRPMLGTMPSKHKTSTQCWINTGPPATTLAQLRYNIGSMSRACWVVYMTGDSPFIARRVNRAPLCAEWLHPLVSRFHSKNTFVQCFNFGPASQTVAQYRP